MPLPLIFLIILALFAGLIIGTITGLTPGIHVNLISAFLLTTIVIPETLIFPFITFIATVAITHVFVDFIPSIFLGAPNEDNFLSILPGHKMLLEGKGIEAVAIALTGALFGIIATIILSYPIILILPKAVWLPNIVPFTLIFVSLYCVLREKEMKIAILIFLLASFLGFAALNLPIKEPLLPLLTGMFGASAMVLAINEKIKIPKQNQKIILPKMKELKKPALASIIIAPLFSVFPGIGSGNIAFASSEIFKTKETEFLFLTGAASAMSTALSFAILYSLGKSRTGVAVAIDKVLPNFSLANLFFILFILLISSILAIMIAIKLSKLFAKNIRRFPYNKISLAILIFITLITLIFSGWRGILVFITSTALGIYAIRSGARRIHLMGCLITPTILFYLFS